jgi:hypothetical protein
MSEEQRAQRFVERHFPVTAAFLAAERGEGPAPIYGPTSLQNDHDDQPEPWVTVRVDYRVSRWELLAALAAGYATANEMQDPDGMTVEQVRYDVEAFLADTSARDLDAMVEEVAAKVERGEDQAQMEALRRAMDRAYPVRQPESPPGFVEEFPHVAAHLARERGQDTVTVPTGDRGDVVLDEPFWCLGEHEPEGYRADISHEGEEVPLLVQTGCHGEVRLGAASLTQRPFSPTDARVLAAVEFDELHEYDARELADMLDSLVAWAIGPMHQLVERLQLLEGGES